MKSYELYVGHLMGTLNGRDEVVERYAELVLRKSSGDVGVCVGTDIGVHTKRNTCCFALGGSQLVDDFKLSYAFHVEAEDVCVESEIYFPVALADSCVHNLVGRETCIERCLYLAAAYTVGAETSMAYELEHFRVDIGLHGVVNLITSVFPRFFIYRVECLL